VVFWLKRRRMTSIGALAVSAAFLLTACGGGSDTGATSTSAPAGSASASGIKLINPGKLTTCTNLPYEPFQFKQGDKVVGFDVDIVDLAAKKLGVTQDIVDIDFAVIKSGAALNAGKCDVAAAGMTITPERQQNIDFSDPYFDATQALLAK
jgi:polar amino acid transport system substrate-binding protein